MKVIPWLNVSTSQRLGEGEGTGEIRFQGRGLRSKASAKTGGNILMISGHFEISYR